MFISMTGKTQVLVRYGFSDYDTFGSGNYAMAGTGNLDAPDYIPQGSMRNSGTAKEHAVMSHAHRDGRNRPNGACHDGPESPNEYRAYR